VAVCNVVSDSREEIDEGIWLERHRKPPRGRIRYRRNASCKTNLPSADLRNSLVIARVGIASLKFAASRADDRRYRTWFRAESVGARDARMCNQDYVITARAYNGELCLITRGAKLVHRYVTCTRARVTSLHVYMLLHDKTIALTIWIGYVSASLLECLPVDCRRNRRCCRKFLRNTMSRCRSYLNVEIQVSGFDSLLEIWCKHKAARGIINRIICVTSDYRKREISISWLHVLSFSIVPHLYDVWYYSRSH
jgi:hypothetical protein